MDPQAQQAIGPELSAGETLIWAGRPQRGIKLRDIDAFLLPFGAIWCAFLIPPFLFANRDGSALFYILPFAMLILGLYFAFGSLPVDAYRRRRTFYGLTNERVVIVAGLFRRHVKTLLIGSLSDLSLDAKADGSGTITLGPTLAWNLKLVWMMPGFGGLRTAFEFIDDATTVYGLVREAHAKAA
jgi:hypothetical protein